MNRDVFAAFSDELQKIAAVDLRGVGPEVQQSSVAPPMETVGFQKARAILDLAQQIKTAAPVAGAYGTGLPQSQNIFTPKPHDSKVEKNVKSLGANVIGGMGVGRLLTDFAHGPKVEGSHKAKWYGMAAGGAAGLANYAIQKHRQRKAMKKEGSFTPAMGLKASQQVGKVKNTIHAGPGIKSQIKGSLIGRKFVP
jgi:hypothetical protein